MKVIFEDYSFSDLNGETYTRVRCVDNPKLFRWVGIKLLGQNPIDKQIYEIDDNKMMNCFFMT